MQNWWGAWRGQARVRAHGTRAGWWRSWCGAFARGAAPDEEREDAERAAVEIAALLRAYTRRINPVPGQGRTADAYSPHPPRLWRVPDALGRIKRLLGMTPDPGAVAGVDLWLFLPGPEALEAAGLTRDSVPDLVLLDRSAMTSTLVPASNSPARARSC
jgi:hypothetical protein